jgi:hypothetical protein
MKMTNCMMIILCAGSLALTGCGGGKPKPDGTTVQQGVTIDVPKFKEAFATASPALKGSAIEAADLIAYKNYTPALAALARVAASPDLTDAQKTIVNQVTDQVKEAASKAPPPAQ